MPDGPTPPRSHRPNRRHDGRADRSVAPDFAVCHGYREPPMADLALGADIDSSHHKTDTATVVNSGDLTTHGVIVGMTGSGKTGLGVVLIEECLSNNIPTLLIDPKGDLTNLCLMFPNMAAADFQPWVNEGDATKAGQSVADFAAAQAKAWSDGLTGWGIGPERIAKLVDGVDFTIYTPGSSAGIGLNIVGSLAAPPDMSDTENIGDEIQGFVSGLLGLVGIDADPLSSREHILLSNLILNEWTNSRNLDLPSLVGMVQNPPIRKLGVFELDQFFPPADRTQLAMRLNGLLASPSFGAWMSGPPIDIGAMLRTPEGTPRCAIVTTSHLSDQERQFVSTLVLSQLVTWMRRQSGTTDLRALLYMDEVAGYLPPTAAPPTKKPIMTLMKQARAFGVGVVLATQNPVDIDYKAISNAGTWMIGRLQTDRDKQRLLDGMSAASGGVDVKAVGDTISGLAKREFVLRRAGKDQPEVFTTRWAMSYLRGPLTRDQIATLMDPRRGLAQNAQATAPVAPPVAGTAPARSSFAPPSGAAAAAPAPAPQPTPAGPAGAAAAMAPGSNDTPVMPEIAAGTGIRWADPASPWLPAIGGDARGTAWEPAIVARVTLRYDDTKADLVHDGEYEAVIFPLGEQVDPTRAIAVDYDDRDLRDQPPAQVLYRLTGAPLKDRNLFAQVQRGLIDYLVRSQTLDLQVNRQLKLFSRPGETAEQFAQRCAAAANEAADADTAKLRDKYQAKTTAIQSQIQNAQDRADVLREQRRGSRSDEILSTAGSILGGLLGGRSRSSILGKVFKSAGSVATKHSRAAAQGERLDAAEGKVDDLNQQLQELEKELTDEVTQIDTQWNQVAQDITTTPITLERADVNVTQLVLAWIPVP